MLATFIVGAAIGTGAGAVIAGFGWATWGRWARR